MTTLITCGDTNGIGPEIAVRSLQYLWEKNKNFSCTLVIPKNIFERVYREHECSFPYSAKITPQTTGIAIVLLPAVKLNIGIPTKDSGAAALLSLETARGLLAKENEYILVTAPISKDACMMAGSVFHGHTEMLASWAKTNSFMMVFASRAMKGGLFTIHEPLKNVPRLLTKKLLRERTEVACKTLQADFGIPNPKIALLGLNPHAGENGLLGNEEKALFTDLIKEYDLSGPYPADAFFATRNYKNFDFILSPYHDQLLIPFKMLSWRDGVNFTAGLPFVRTSPDHGVAYDIAGRQKADISSILAAIKLGKKIFHNRKKHHV